MHQLKSCGVLVVRGEPVDSFLMMVHPDRFDMPKGHVDAGETEVECALRELVEETGIQSEDIRLDTEFRYESKYIIKPKRTNYEECEKTLVMFLGRLIRDVEIQLTEHESFKWVDWSPPHKIQEQSIDPLLKALEDFLSK